MNPIPQREKTWAERTVEENVETLRRELRYLIDRVTRLSGQLEALRTHKHLDGEIVVPFNQRSTAECGGRRDPLA